MTDFSFAPDPPTETHCATLPGVVTMVVFLPRWTHLIAVALKEWVENMRDDGELVFVEAFLA